MIDNTLLKIAKAHNIELERQKDKLKLLEIIANTLFPELIELETVELFLENNAPIGITLDRLGKILNMPPHIVGLEVKELERAGIIRVIRISGKSNKYFWVGKQ